MRQQVLNSIVNKAQHIFAHSDSRLTVKASASWSYNDVITAKRVWPDYAQ